MRDQLVRMVNEHLRAGKPLVLGDRLGFQSASSVRQVAVFEEGGEDHVRMVGSVRSVVKPSRVCRTAVLGAPPGIEPGPR